MLNESEPIPGAYIPKGEDAPKKNRLVGFVENNDNGIHISAIAAASGVMLLWLRKDLSLENATNIRDFIIASILLGLLFALADDRVK